MTGIRLELPAWVEAARDTFPDRLPTARDRMAVAIDLARRNVDAGTGGPFGAVMVDAASGDVIAVGVNCVEHTGLSLAHAEVMALAGAQVALGRHDLGAAGLPACEIVVSAQPCAMCLGALLWGGVRHIVCGARRSDVEAIGFDEGPRPERWQEALAARGVTVQLDVMRDEAVAVLDAYRRGGGSIYNPTR